MEWEAGQEGEYNDVVETLTSMFGNIISKEVILAVVESCDGDLNLAAEAVMSMSSDAADNIMNTTSDQTESERKATPGSAETTPSLNQGETPESIVQLSSPAMSYAGASRSTGAVPKQLSRPRPPRAIVWTDQLRKIITYHNQGSRVLILMRGAPGSGKSYLAKQIIEMIIGTSYVDYKTHICSTDDFFMVRGEYQYQKSRLSEAHDWNQNRVRHALRQGLSPIIVDNTNIEIWEMEPYVREGVRNGYIIEVVEPNTPWAKKANQLLKKSTHSVPITTIKRMLDNYQNGITGENIIKYYGLSYPADKVPPGIRTMPEYVPPQVDLAQNIDIAQSDVVNTKCEETQNVIRNEPSVSDSAQAQIEIAGCLSPPGERIIPIEIESEEEELARQKRYTEIQKQLEEIEKVEQEWENGEDWGGEQKETVNSNNEIPAILEPRPQRRTDSEGSTQSTPREKLLDSVERCDDWRKYSLFMPSWTDEPPPLVDEYNELPVKETNSIGTCVQVGDTDLHNPRKIFKVITATPRDINQFNICLKDEKIPAVRMFDKSSMTNEFLITEAYRCKNEEQHFVAFRKLFKNVPKAALRDIFDKCCGDVNWAVDIVLGGMADKQLELTEGKDVSDTEEETIKEEQCNCLAAYQLMPDTDTKTPMTTKSTADQQNIPTHSTEINLLPQKKVKISQSDSTQQLKREIEKNIVISDDHYSPHALKLRKWRRGEDFETVPTQTAGDLSEIEMEPLPGTSKDYLQEENQQTNKDEAVGLSDDEVSDSSSLDDAERTVNVNVGREFIAQLDSLFGRQGMTYPENIVPRINIPVSLLNEINAFWMESLMCQLDEQDKQDAKMLKEDAEFARQLEIKEAELDKLGKEPEVPDFKEIMDMDFALSLYQKDVAEWRSKEPMDLAAKLSRDKLYNLFPDTNPEILSELLMAHDNNFQATVEVLLMSTGKANILEDKNGLSKFVMEKEMERQEKIMAEEKEALKDVEWPLPKGEKVDMAVVEGYRQKAEKHLAQRQLNYQKAQDYIRRGMTQVASHYSEFAQFHKQKYEQANSLAAASLIQVHAENCPDNATIDLHYLRVGEAKETLDLFLDFHIQKLKEGGIRGVRSYTLYFITGRGLHSNGRPRVKPAVKKRLRERGLAFSERNPGLLTAKVCAEDKLSYQVQVP